MNGKDLKTIEGIKDALVSQDNVAHVKDAVIIDPAKEVEQSLVSFVTYRFNKVKDSVAYEEDVKEVIMSRISEATFPQLIALLQTIQKGNSDSTMALLAPFIDQSNGRTLPENLRTSVREDASAGAVIYEESDSKHTLQAFTALYQVLEHLAEKNDEKKKS